MSPNLPWAAEWYIWAALVVEVLGLLTAGVGVVWLFRTVRGSGSWRGNSLGRSVPVLLGVCLCAISTYFIWTHPQGFQLLLQQDYENPEKFDKLKTSPLDSTDTPAKTAGEWPQWRGPHRDGISSETGLRTDWAAAPPPVVWKRAIGGGYSSMAIADGRLYTLDKKDDQERVLCLDAVTGRELWVHSYPVDYAALQYATGPRATPTVADGRVYTVGATGVFLCLEGRPSAEVPQAPSKVLWEHHLLQEFDGQLPSWGVTCSPLIEGDVVCVQPGGKKGSVAAFDRRTGKVLWQALSDRPGYSSPVAATMAGVRQIICFTAEGVAGLRAASGDKLWYYTWPTEFDANIATPILAGNYVFISSGYDAGCALLELSSDGSGGVRAEPVYVKRNKLMRSHHSTCVLYEGHLYGFDGNSPAFLKCVDVRAGKETWTTREVEKGALILADGHLIVLTESGALVLVEASPSGFRTKGAMRDLLQGPECWALPALAGGRLYLRDREHLVCLDLLRSRVRE